MVWNTVYPDGTQSVGANVPIGLQNTSYTKTTLNNDHFWDVGTDEDGHHRYVQMPQNQVGGTPTNPTLATGMDGVMYLKETNSRVEGFYKNAAGVFQFIPSFLEGTVSLISTTDYTNIAAIPQDTFGYAWLFVKDSSQSGAYGFFKAADGICQAYSLPIRAGNSGTSDLNVRYGNGDQVDGLNFRARRSSGPSGTYEYRIMYWQM